MANELVVQLSPTHVRLQPGGTPTEVVVTIANQSGASEQYSIEVTGLEAEWFTPPPPSVRLFDGDREPYRFTLHPTRRAGRGSFVYRVLVRSRSGVQETAEGTLEVLGQPQYELRMPVMQQSGRGQGRFTVQVVNTGGADIGLVLDAQSTDSEGEVRFGRDPTIRVAVGQTLSVPVSVRPRKKPFIGSERNYNFTVTSRPDDPALPPRTAAGVFTYQPLMTSWAPIRRTIIAILAVGLGMTILAAVLPVGIAGPLGFVRTGLCAIPIVDSLCPDTHPPVAACKFSDGFQAYAVAEAQLIGACVTVPLDDGFGNVRQYTRNGVLFWHNSPNTVYFLKDDTLFAFIDEKSIVIHGSGKT